MHVQMSTDNNLLGLLGLAINLGFFLPKTSHLLIQPQTIMDRPLTQEFRAHTSTNVISIPTRQDTKSGQRVVRWQDIQRCFENAKGLVIGEDAVLFLTDEDLQDLVPPRIVHHPGVIIEVLTCSNSDGRVNNRQPPLPSFSGVTKSTSRLDAMGFQDRGSIQTLCMHSRVQASSKSSSAVLKEMWTLRQQGQEIQQQVNEAQQKIQRGYRKTNRRSTLAASFSVILLSIVFVFFTPSLRQRQQQPGDSTVQTYQTQYPQQSLQQHIDESVREIKELDVALQVLQEMDQRSQESRQQLKWRMGEIIQRLSDNAENSLQQDHHLDHQTHQQMNELQRMLQNEDQQEQDFHQQLREQLGAALQQVQRMSRQLEVADEQGQHMNHQVQVSHEQQHELQENQQGLQKQADAYVQWIERPWIPRLRAELEERLRQQRRWQQTDVPQVRMNEPPRTWVEAILHEIVNAMSLCIVLFLCGPRFRWRPLERRM
ncbi:hypothetical protein B0O80DRAFT_127219 [Mortierella sp. GBAus27b]|nr:hypothetical protein B0O80DRAFT_127219 [Mortierella sp. GBAus27b]